MSAHYGFEVRTLNGRVFSRHPGMFLAACAAALWNILHEDPRIHWIGEVA